MHTNHRILAFKRNVTAVYVPNGSGERGLLWIGYIGLSADSRSRPTSYDWRALS